MCVCVCVCVHVHVRGEASRKGEVEVGLGKLFECSWRFVAEGGCLATRHLVSWLFFFLIFFFFNLNLFNWRLITLQYCIGFANINMNPPRVYTCSPSWTPSHLPPHTIPLGHPSAPAPSILYPASNLDWWFISHMLLYMFQCHSPKSSHLLPLLQSPTDCSIHLSLLLSCIQGYRYHLSKFHIYALVYCIGVFLSGLLHSV